LGTRQFNAHSLVANISVHFFTLARSGAVLLAFLVITPTSLKASQNTDADQLQKSIDQTISRARNYINDPGILVDIMDTLGPVADDPRVLSFCAEIVDKSTNSASIVHAVQMLNGIANRYSKDNKERQKIAGFILKAARKDDEFVQLQSYDALSSMEGRYRHEAHEGYKRILSAKYQPQDEKRHKTNCVFTVQSFLRSSPLDTADIAVIRTETERMGLVNFYKKVIFNRDSKSAEESSQRFLDEWLAVVDSKSASNL
jgi:hypothetical protein